MGKSKKAFAKVNGRKKARLARKDTKKKSVFAKRSERMAVKLEADDAAEQLKSLKITGEDGVERTDGDDWTDIGSITTGGGLRITPKPKDKVRILTRKQVVRKEKKIARGTSYQARLTKDEKMALAKRIQKRIAGSEYRKDVSETRALNKTLGL